MTVSVRFIGSLHGISGRSNLVFSLQDVVSFAEFVREIVKERPKLEPVLIDPERGSVKTNVLVLINGKEIGVLNGLETKVKDGDEVVLVPVVHGG